MYLRSSGAISRFCTGSGGNSTSVTFPNPRSRMSFAAAIRAKGPASRRSWFPPGTGWRAANASPLSAARAVSTSAVLPLLLSRSVTICHIATRVWQVCRFALESSTFVTMSLLSLSGDPNFCRALVVLVQESFHYRRRDPDGVRDPDVVKLAAAAQLVDRGATDAQAGCHGPDAQEMAGPAFEHAGRPWTLCGPKPLWNSVRAWG